MDNFDWNYYLENNLDLKQNGFITKEDAIIHWKEYGEKEGRIHRFLKNETEYYIMNIKNLLTQNMITKEESWDILINIMCEKDNTEYGYFDWEYYLIENESLFNKTLLSKEEALEHWNKIGKYDYNFKYSKDYIILEKITKDNFDWIYYIKNNIDLIKNNILTLDKAWEHWINYGKYENRKYKCKFDQNITYETFDWEYYLNNNPDLINLTQEGAWQHWIYYGRYENRQIRLYKKVEEHNTINLSEQSVDKELFSEVSTKENTLFSEISTKENTLFSEVLTKESEVSTKENTLFSEVLTKENTMNLSEKSIDKENILINNIKQNINLEQYNIEQNSIELNKNSIEYYLEILNNKENKDKLIKSIDNLYKNIKLKNNNDEPYIY